MKTYDRMPKERLNYHSVFDPGNAAILWPVKNKFLAVDRSHPFDLQLLNIVRFHLLWHPSLIVRHIDLFNNVLLMRFMQSTEAKLMRENGMISVIVPNADKFQDIFAAWALDRRGQHFHHLSSQEQRQYDEHCRTKGMSMKKAAERLSFSRYGIDVLRTLDEYEFFFRDLRKTLAWNPPSDEYPNRVLRSWKELLLHAEKAQQYSPEAINKVGVVITEGVAEGWRRREFFTALEKLESFEPFNITQQALLRDTKLLALNSPFYDELEALRYSTSDMDAPVWVTRDLSRVSHLRTKPKVALSEQDYYPALRREVLPFHKVPLSWIIQWHNSSLSETNPEYKAFQKSVAAIDAVISGAGGIYLADQIYGMINHHVDILNECVERTSKDENAVIERETNILQAFSPKWGSTIGAGTGLALASIAGLAGVFQGWTAAQNFVGTALAGLISLAVTITLTSPVVQIKTTVWDLAEGVLKREIESKVKEHADLIPNPVNFV